MKNKNAQKKSEEKYLKFCPYCGSIDLTFDKSIAQNALLMHVDYICRKCNSKFMTPFEGTIEFIKEFKNKLRKETKKCKVKK